jgi:DNA-binding HxlR family transcriptional regulator
VGQVLALVGKRWALLVVREVSLGLRRFNELEAATGAPRAVPSDRLRRLTTASVLAPREYVVPGSRAATNTCLPTPGTTC